MAEGAPGHELKPIVLFLVLPYKEAGTLGCHGQDGGTWERIPGP